MCLAIPARIVSVGAFRMAEVDILGVTRKVSLDLVPEAVAGDHVLVHAGFAIQVVTEAEAQETLDFLMQTDLFAEDRIPAQDRIPAEELTVPDLAAEEVQ